MNRLTWAKLPSGELRSKCGRFALLPPGTHHRGEWIGYWLCVSVDELVELPVASVGDGKLAARNRGRLLDEAERVEQNHAI